MQWLKILALGLLLTSLTSLSVLAASPGAPTNLTLTYINEHEVGVEWTKGIDAENTMVRAYIGSVPLNRTAGYLVYYGDETSCSDTAVSLEETVDVYYRAWSQNLGGEWEEEGISASIGGRGLTLFAIVTIILALMVMGFIFKNGILFLASSLGWIFFAFLMFVETFDNAAMNTGLLMFGGIMAIVTAVLALRIFMSARPKKLTENDEQRAYGEKVRKITTRRK